MTWEEQIVAQGMKALAKKHHPDTAPNPQMRSAREEAMKQMIQAAEWLESVCQAVARIDRPLPRFDRLFQPVAFDHPPQPIASDPVQRAKEIVQIFEQAARAMRRMNRQRGR